MFLLILKWNFLHFILSTLLPVHNSEESYSVIFSHRHLIRYLYTLRRPLLSLLFPRLNNPSGLSLSFCFRCSDPLIVFVALCWTCSSMFVSLLYCGIRFTQKFTGSSFGCKPGVFGELECISPSFDKKCHCPWRIYAWLFRIESGLCEGFPTRICEWQLRQVCQLISRELYCQVALVIVK